MIKEIKIKLRYLYRQKNVSNLYILSRFWVGFHLISKSYLNSTNANKLELKQVIEMKVFRNVILLMQILSFISFSHLWGVISFIN